MLKMVRVMAGMDAQYERHLEGLKAVFNKAFSFNAPYIEKIEAFARGERGKLFADFGRCHGRGRSTPGTQR